MALLSSGSRLLSSLGNAAAGGRRQKDGASGPTGSTGGDAQVLAERTAQLERQRSVREIPDLSLEARRSNAAPLLPSAGPLALGGNSLLGI